MADIDDFIAQRVQGNRRQAAPAPSGGSSDIDEFIKSRVNRVPNTPRAEDAANVPSDQAPGFLAASADLAKGAGKALVGMGASIGDIAGPPKKSTEHVLPMLPNPFEIAQHYRDWADEPLKGTAEHVGYGIGSIAPGVIAGPLGVGGRVAKTVAGGVTGAIEAGLQPTKEGTLSSHLSAMPEGFIAGMIPGVGGTTLHQAANLARWMHFPIPHIPRVATSAYHAIMRAINNPANGLTAAQRQAQSLYAAHYFANLSRQAQRAASSIGGATVGQALGTRYDPREHSDAENQ